MSETTQESLVEDEKLEDAEYPFGDQHPTRIAIDKWKEQYAPAELHAFPLTDDFEKVVIMKTITRPEFAEVQLRQASPEEFDAWLISNFVLYPSVETIIHWAESTAGVMMTIGDQIFKHSGFLQNVPTIKL